MRMSELSQLELENVLVAIDGKVATITLNRPKKKNAMSPDLHRDMGLVFDHLDSRDDIQVLVMTGAGDAFCTGMDLEQFIADGFEDPAQFRLNTDLAFGWFRRLKAFTGVTIASINGWCVAGGMLVAAICDLAFTAEEARFGLSEINFATIPGAGLTWVTAELLNRREALFYLTTGRTFDGVEAAKMGLVNYALPLVELSAHTTEIAREIAGKHPIALRSIKETYYGTRDKSFEDGVDYEAAKLFELGFFSEDEWIKIALKQFKARTFKPGIEDYSAEDKS